MSKKQKKLQRRKIPGAIEGRRPVDRRLWLLAACLLGAGIVVAAWPTADPRDRVAETRDHAVTPVGSVPLENDSSRSRAGQVTDRAPEVRDTGRSKELATAPATYVGIEHCRGCHAERVEEFTATAHFHSSRTPLGNHVTGGFGGSQNQYATRNPDLWFQMDVDEQGFKQTAVTRSEGRWQQQTHHVGMVFGAGKYDENYHYWKGNQLFRLPIAWLRTDEAWVNTPGFFDGTADFQRVVGPRCLECHCTWIEHIPGTKNSYKPETAILGITCERCHGPASHHVDFHKANPQADLAQQIVKPAELDRERRIEICSQCHSEATRRRSAPFSYVPGQPLEQHFAIDAPKHPELERTANQTQQMRDSVCFQRSASMTCVTCHDPHRVEEHDALHAATCYGCHQEPGQHESLPVELRQKCIDCHMPQRPVMNVTFSTATDEYIPLIHRHEHRIGIYLNAAKAVWRDWLGRQSNEADQRKAEELSAQLAESFHQEARDLVAQHRYVAALGMLRQAIEIAPANEEMLASYAETKKIQAELDRLQDQARQVAQAAQESQWQDRSLLTQAVSCLEACLGLKPNDALAHYTLGMMLHKLGRTDAAVDQVQQGLQLDPEHYLSYLLLAHISEDRGDLFTALSQVRSAEQLEPFDAEVQLKLGTLHAQLSQWPEAEQHLRQAVAIKPQDAWGYSRLAMALVENNKLPEALQVARRAVALTRFQDADAVETLAKVYLELGRDEEAAKVRQRLK